MNKRNLLFVLIALTAVFVYGKSNVVKPTRNVIFFVVDGCSTSDLAVARWYKQLTSKTNEDLALDPYLCGLVRMQHTDAPIVGSAGSMSTLMTGQLASSPVVCTYPQPHEGMDMVKVDPLKALTPATNLMDIARQQQGKSLGVVVTTYFCHATPAATAAHAASRNNYAEIVAQMASMDLSVCFGGGTKYITPQMRSILKAKNTTLIEGPDYNAFRNFKGDKLWAIMARSDMSYEIDRPQEEPSLAEMTTKAISMLSKNKKGFFLMVEGSQVDFAAHANDPIGVIGDFLAFDNAIKVAIDFAKKDRNTTVVIITDHGNSGMTFADSKFANYSSSNIATALGELPNFKSTSFAMSNKMKGRKVSEMKDIIQEGTGIVITPEEEARLIKLAGVTEEDYMKVGTTANLVSEIAKIMTSRTHITFATGRHTGEDVFFAVYNPNDQRPEGFLKNTEVNEYVRKVMGISKPLEEYTSKYFVPDSKLFTDAKRHTHKSGITDLAVNLPDGRTAIFESNSSLVTVKSASSSSIVDLKRPAVYIDKRKHFYLPANISDLLMKQAR